MFTGIITNVGKVEYCNKNENCDLVLIISCDKNKISRNLDIGCSIACNGICLTLIRKSDDNEKTLLEFQASQETCSKTTINSWEKGKEINIEFSLRFGDELGGHMVLGHVDSKTKIINISSLQDSNLFEFEIPNNLEKFIAKKGSVTIDGVSLTINEVDNMNFAVNIISHTFENTIFKNYKVGDFVNIEIDTIARYINNLMQNR